MTSQQRLPTWVLKCATKALNDTMGENGLVPSLLVFGIVPRFPILSSNLPEQQERMRVLAAAQAEYNSIVAERRKEEILKSRVPGEADRVYKVGEEVLVWREKSESWTGPFIVTGVNDKPVNVRIEELAYEGRFNLAQVKPNLRDMPQTDANTNFSEVLHQMLRDFTTEEGSGLSPSYAVHLTEIIRKGDVREKLFDDAKKKEIAGLIRRGTWKIVLREELEPGENIMTGRFVLSIKNANTQEEMLKARFVCQEYRDRAKTSLVHDTALARQSGARVLIELAAVFGFRLCSTDEQQAYLQSSSELMRDVYIEPSGESNCNQTKC
jgi:hypothetical protein